MTHSLHRRGDDASLRKDYLVISCVARGYNDHYYREAAQEYFRICMKHKPVNGGDMKTGNILFVDPDVVIDRLTSSTVLQVTFDSKENVIACIKELKERDLGISIVITALIDEATDIARQAGLEQVHTREFSLGTHGRVKLLPEYEVLEFTTMCGHGLVAGELVKKMIVDSKKGRASLREAAVHMAGRCSCGNFNVNRAVELLEKNVPLWTGDYPVY
jgi:hypothetical protein